MSFQFTDQLDRWVHEHAESHCQEQLQQAATPAERQQWARILHIIQNPQALAHRHFHPQLRPEREPL